MFIGELLRDAYRLICDCESGANQADFRTEFYSYWNRGLSTEEEKLRSLLVAGGPSRLVQIWRGKTRSVVDESEAQILNWLRNLHGNKPQFDSTDAACLLWIKEPLLPGEYPKTAADLYRIAGSISGGRELLESFVKLGSSPFHFLIGAESGNGPCLAAVRAHKPVSKDVRGKIRDRANNGFRPGKVPPQLQTQRLFSSDASANRMQVERVDAEWIHGRGQDPRQKALGTKTVLLFGGGSVGAPVGQHLAMAGVGHIMTIDPANLSWANVGRHPLGADHVATRKAIALSETWRKAYPHARFEGFDSTAHGFLAEHPELVAKADLIICATADWKAELKRRRDRCSPPLCVDGTQRVRRSCRVDFPRQPVSAVRIFTLGRLQAPGHRLAGRKEAADGAGLRRGFSALWTDRTAGHDFSRREPRVGCTARNS
jgi:sulfur-carrier protein adenylyltransferase/sulfurtransferase